MKQDYYDILGVNRSATPDEVKAAYKRLAKKYHPDLNRDNPDAEAKFKEVNEAFRVVGDEKKRAAYDRFGHDEQAQSQGGPQGGGYSGFEGFDVDLGDIFGEFFGGGRGRSRKGEDIVVATRITLEEVESGVTKKIHIDRRAPCEHCKGSGAEGGKRKQCGTCKGAGQVRRAQRTPFGVMQTVVACDVCRGSGSTAEVACKPCRGSGSVEKEEIVSVDIPAGIHDRMQMRVPGYGHVGMPGLPAGDLLVAVMVTEHKLFVRDENDLLIQSTITYPQAVLGAKLEVPTLSGSVTLQVPSGTESHTVLRVRNKGLPGLRGGKGDLLVSLRIAVPKSPSKKEKELIEALGGVEKPKSFFERFKLG